MTQQTAAETYRLFERGEILVQDTAVEVRLGMAVLTYNGRAVGHIAAACLMAGSRLASQLLITAAQPPGTYRLVPVSLVSRVEQNRVWLNLAQTAVEHLPVRQIQQQGVSRGRHSL